MRVKVGPIPGLVSEPFHVVAKRISDGKYACTVEETGEDVGVAYRDGRFWRESGSRFRYKRLKDVLATMAV